MKLGWLANTRPDDLFETATIAQVTLEHFNSDHRECIKRFNRYLRYEVTHRVSLAIPKLDAKSLLFFGLSGASFANNCDISTQIGYIVYEWTFTTITYRWYSTSINHVVSPVPQWPAK